MHSNSSIHLYELKYSKFVFLIIYNYAYKTKPSWLLCMYICIQMWMHGKCMHVTKNILQINDEETAASKNYYATKFQSYGFYVSAFHNDLLSPLIFLWNLRSVIIRIFGLLNYNIHIKEPWANIDTMKDLQGTIMYTNMYLDIRQWS